MVTFLERKGDFLAAQRNQERLLDLLVGGGGHKATIIETLRKLVELHGKSSRKLEAVARKLGLDVKMTTGSPFATSTGLWR